jgi:hypothetical protein
MSFPGFPRCPGIHPEETKFYLLFLQFLHEVQGTVHYVLAWFVGRVRYCLDG